jgi:tetratricopeptide (TPR) repeat protein
VQRPLDAATRRELDPDRLAALEEERDFLLRSLDDLEREHDAGDVDDTDYESLKDDYTARAATVLRAIENRHSVMAATRDPRRRNRGWLVGTVVVVLALVLGVFVAQSSGRRAPGESISGDIRQSSRDQLLEARRVFSEGDYPEAIKVYDKVLEQNPNDREALAYRGWMLRLVSLQTQDAEQQKVLLGGALRSLDAAVAADETYPDARVFRAVVYRDLGQAALALNDLNSLEAGSIPEDMAGMVGNLRAQLVEAVETSGTAPGTSTP